MVGRRYAVAVRFLRRKRRRLELGQSLGAFRLPEGDISPLYIFFEVANAGDETVEVSRVGVGLKGGERLEVEDLLEGERTPPFTLGTGESVRLQVRARALARKLGDAGYGGRPRVRLVVEDSAGNDFEKSFRFRVEEYLRLVDE